MSPQDAYQLVYNFMSLAIAAMGASFFFFVSARGSLKEGNRMAVTLSAVVVLIAFYHYVRIFDSWVTFGTKGAPFNEAYRYVDWLLTVPLLVAELVLVLKLDKKLESTLIKRNVVYAFLMIATGYVGEMTEITSVDLASPRTIWGAISSVFFVLILRDLFGGIDASIKKQSKEIFKILRVVLIATWGVYPIAYLLPAVAGNLGLTAQDGLVLKQVGYTIADILAKPGYGLLIWKIATLKNGSSK
jgi:bacteriorhodopsin